MSTTLLTARQACQLLGVTSYDTFAKHLQPFLLRLRTPGGRYRYSAAYIRVFLRVLHGQRPTEARARAFAQSNIGRTVCQLVTDRWMRLAQQLAEVHDNALTSTEIATLSGTNSNSVNKWKEFFGQRGGYPHTFTLKSVLHEIEWVWPGRA